MTSGTRFILAITLIISSLTLSLHSQAGHILSADTVSSPQGELEAYPLVQIIDQSGLSANYFSGLTDFESFVSTAMSTALGDAGFTATESFGPQIFTFGFNQAVNLDGIAVWNTGSAGAVNLFSLFADTDTDFYNGTQAELISQKSLDAVIGNGSVAAQAFQFDTTATRYIHLVGLSSLAAPDFYGFSEVAFSLAATPVPLPATLGMYFSALIFTFLGKRAHRLV